MFKIVLDILLPLKQKPSTNWELLILICLRSVLSSYIHMYFKCWRLLQKAHLRLIMKVFPWRALQWVMLHLNKLHCSLMRRGSLQQLKIRSGRWDWLIFVTLARCDNHVHTDAMFFSSIFTYNLNQNFPLLFALLLSRWHLTTVPCDHWNMYQSVLYCDCLHDCFV